MSLMKTPLRIALATVSAGICCAAAAAQNPPQQPAAMMEEVTVTGTRIERTDIDSVGPVTVITETEIEATGITSLEVLLQRLPAAAGFGGNQTSAYWVSNGWGTPQINLRGLGINRTLVLVNGRRVVFGGTGANSSVDLSMIPMSLIGRIEVLKDGASATYGADAMAGVVNLITKPSVQGFEIEGKFGMTAENDGEENLLDLTWGRSGAWGDLMVNLSYQDNDASPLADRVPCPLASTSATACSGSSSTIGGRTTLPAGALLPDGSVLTEPTRINFNQTPGGDGDFYEVFDSARHGFNYNPYFNAVQPIERLSFTTLGSYALSDTTRWFTELMYTRRDSTQPASPATLRDIAYAADHPTNPTGVDFVLERRRLLENGARRFEQDVKTWRVVTGIEGDINDDWSYDLALNWGRNTATDAITNNINMRRVGATLDTDLCGANGIPCADYIGFGDVTAEVLDYIVFNQEGTGGNKQISFSANITGAVLALPAGSLRFAGGLEWREDKGWRDPDPLVLAGIALGNQADAIAGEIEAREVYGEVHIPVVSGLPWVQALDLDLALRHSDYDLFGDESTYKAGLNWQITDAVKLRGTLTTAFRAPNVPELFGGVSEGNLTTADPCSGYAALSPSSVVYQNCRAAGVPLNYNQLGSTILTDRGGNPELQPESADTYTLGLVLEPLPGLSVTIDYFDIDIDDAVREISGSNKLATCYNSAGLSHEFCAPSHHTRNTANGDINFLSTQKFNTGREVMQGVDFGAVYRFEAAGLSNTLDLQTTYLKKYESIAFDGDQPTVIDGFIGDGNGGYPQWRANASLTTRGDRWSGTYSVQMIGEGEDFNATTGIGSRMPSVFYHNTQFSYAVSDAVNVSVGIDNLFDREAPRVASWTDGNTDTMTYDLAGRRGYIRLTYKID
ncbi:TonB-dependent receptor [Exilibacterium tricleocarpae]|uniref:TonB-dependent receptor n=1 Tax=Exilibacterium tricleocarpae TaxID=2591008 RepID=A0A545TLN2_9GAMM|nr:TonB-dependent receptor [Exilibacterium tricleocarpae]TQV78143.1 TonB-dependent receptor [Exilibacterium tricleocarpae]